MKESLKNTSKFFENFIKLETAGGILLILSATLAFVCANIPGIDHLYEGILHLHVFGWIPGVKALKLNLSVHHIINDGFMAIFFFLVGLELKREMLEGNLSDPHSRRLPFIGAIGGMIVPAIIYYSLNRSNNIAASGWAIPTATDIAFAIGVIILLGSRVPGPLKVFLTSLAIFDDLGAVLIIAVFYTSQISSEFLVLAGVCVLILKGLNKVNVVEKTPYLCVGAVMWYFALRSGIHSTIAGVIVATFIPLFKENEDVYPLKEIEHSLHPWVAYGILPVFAFANAGINVRGMGIDQLVHPVPIGIALGLFFGKQIGVFGLSLVAIKFKKAELPTGVSFGNLYGASLLCGIGFTMSLFIGGLSFGSDKLFDERLGIILGSLFSGITGYIVLRLVNKGKDYSKK